MRILHVVHQYLPESVGGTELYTQSLARAQVAAGNHVAVFYPSPAEPSPEPLQPEVQADGLRIWAVPAGPRSRTSVFLATWRAHALEAVFAHVLEAERPDLVHIQQLMGLPTALVQQVQAAQIPYVVTLHDYWYVCANAQLVTNYDSTVCAGPRGWVNCGRCVAARAGFDLPVLGPVLAPVLANRTQRLRAILADAAAVITPTEFVRGIYTNLGMPVERAVIIPHGIALPREQPSGERAGKQAAKQLHIVYVGSVAWQKGVHVLVQAVNELSSDVRLTIYGDLTAFPDYVAELQAMARHPGIRFVGQVGRAELWSGLAQADVLAVPSVWYETAALVIQEAFAAGVPVIASRLGVMPERIHAGVDGLLAPPGDVAAWRAMLQQLLNEPALLAELRAGIRPVRTVEEHLDEVMRLYEAALITAL